MIELFIILAIVAVVIVGLAAYFMRDDEEKEVEVVEELDLVNRPLADFRQPSQTEEELRYRVERLENAVLLIEQAFKWKLIPEPGEEPIISVVEQVEQGYIIYVPAITIDTDEPETPSKPILPRFVG